MSKIYLVWCRGPEDKEDRIRGAALNWQTAERMALNLELHLKSQGKEHQVGVKVYLHGELFLDPELCHNSWDKSEFETEEVESDW